MFVNLFDILVHLLNCYILFNEIPFIFVVLYDILKLTFMIYLVVYQVEIFVFFFHLVLPIKDKFSPWFGNEFNVVYSFLEHIKWVILDVCAFQVLGFSLVNQPLLRIEEFLVGNLGGVLCRCRRDLASKMLTYLFFTLICKHVYRRH